MRCIIVDDESPSREELKYFINNFSSVEIVEEFDDSLEALNFIESNDIDVVFLDINMPKLDGVCLARVIKKFNKDFKIVFITAYKEHAIEAFELEAFDYILKPYSEERILTTLKKIERLDCCEEKKCICDRVTLLKGEKMIVVNIDDIYYCKSSERDALVYTKNQEYTVNMSISEFYNKICGYNFFKSHRSYILNIDKIEEIIPWFNNTYNVKLKNLDIEIPVSRKNIKEFKHIMGI